MKGQQAPQHVRWRPFIQVDRPDKVSKGWSNWSTSTKLLNSNLLLHHHLLDDHYHFKNFHDYTPED